MNTKRKAGFTLIELLVVIAIIAVLMGILMPALRAVKQQAAAINCTANCRSLATAWFMYAGENDGKIVPAIMADNGWIGTPRSQTGVLYTSQQVTPVVEDEDEIRGIKAGLLYKYIGDAGVYHCPADTMRISVHDQSRVFTSYVVPTCLNGWPNDGNPQIKKIDKIKSPSTKYNFVEAAETRNYNMAGHFVIGAPEYTGSSQWMWWGPMAVNHNKGSVLGFCDGHAEKHVWRNKYTLERVDKVLNQGGGSYGQQPAEPGQTEDLEYMAKGWAYEHLKGFEF